MSSSSAILGTPSTPSPAPGTSPTSPKHSQQSQQPPPLAPTYAPTKDVVSLANFASTNFPLGSHPYMSSPRSIEVMNLSGVTLDDLLPRPMSFYMDKVREDRVECVATRMEDLAELRLERGEISRRKLIRKLRGDRER